jgi:hypothetical protein
MAELKPETLDFLFDFITPLSERQLQAADALDSKAVQVFSAASVVIGLLALARETVAGGFLVAAALLYLGVAVSTFYAIKVRQFRVTRHADDLWQRHWHRDVAAIKHSLVSDAAEAYAENKNVLHDKRVAVSVALAATALETLAVVTALMEAVWG